MHELDAALQDSDNKEKDDFEFDELFIGTLVVVSVEKNPNDSWTETICVQGQNITFMLDTGAQCIYVTHQQKTQSYKQPDIDYFEIFKTGNIAH